MNRRLPLAAAFLAAASLAACSSESEAPAPAANETGNAVEVIDEAPVQNFAEPEPTPSPTPSPTPIVEDDLPTDEQVQEDADAVGMTARLPRDEAANEAAPAD